MNLLKLIFNTSYDESIYNNFEHCSKLVIQFKNCRIMRGNQLVSDDLWIRNGVILDPEKLFFDEKKTADLQIDCEQRIIAPGFIDVQLNGGFGKDFTSDRGEIADVLDHVSRRLLEYGVIAYCPTIVSSDPSVYSKLIPNMHKSVANKHDKTDTEYKRTHGSSVLGIHLEGPFINKEKLGAHDSASLCTFEQGLVSLERVYGSLETLKKNVAIVTLAPELDQNGEIVRYLANNGIVVSLGHSMANLEQGKKAIENGARFITHLFNAMQPFHHRDPHLIGLLSSRSFNHFIYYGIIADNIHTHPSAINIAYSSHPDGLILVTDAMSAMGLPEGDTHKVGQKEVEIMSNIFNGRCVKSAYIKGTRTLCGSVVTMNECVRNLIDSTGCSIVSALKCAAEHPAKMLGIYPRKGSLDYGADADFIIIDEEINVYATFLNGDLAWSKSEWAPLFKFKFFAD
jgi:N-acetylglucosamine-6-phosphate deacetylase